VDSSSEHYVGGVCLDIVLLHGMAIKEKKCASKDIAWTSLMTAQQV